METTPCRVEIDTSKHHLDMDSVKNSNKEAEIDEIYEQLCNSESYLWEAISRDGVPKKLDDAITEAVGDALSTNDFEQLGRIIGGYASAYIREYAIMKWEQKQ